MFARGVEEKGFGGDGSLSQQKELLDKYQENSIAQKMLEALFATDKIELEGYEANEVHLSLGIPTSTTLVLTPAEQSG